MKVEDECTGKKNRRFRAELDVVGENNLAAAFRNALTYPTPVGVEEWGSIEGNNVIEQPTPVQTEFYHPFGQPDMIVTMNRGVDIGTGYIR